MPTTQCEDPNERVDHPRHYNQSPSGIETIELIEHLPCNFAMAAKYVWRCGLKQSETPLRDLRSARWYTQREQERIELFELDFFGSSTKTDVVWRSLARKVIRAEPESDLSDFLIGLLHADFEEMLGAIDQAIADIPATNSFSANVSSIGNSP